MGIFRSGQSPAGIYYGDIAIQRVYLGDTLIWEQGGPVTVLPAPAAASAAVLAPNVSAGTRVQASPATATAVVRDPVIGVIVRPTPATATAAVRSSNVRHGTTITPTPATAQAVVRDAQLATTITPTPAQAGAAVRDAEVQVGATLHVTPASASAAVREATLAIVVQALAAPAAAAVHPPTISAGQVISAIAAAASAQALAPTLQITIVDDFNRADDGMGPDYTTLGAQAPVLVSNRVQAASPPNNTSLIYAARHNGLLLSDNQEIVFAPIAATAGSSLGLGGGAFLRCSAGGDRVEALVTNNQAVVNTRIGGTAVNRAAASISTPTSVRMTAIGNVYSIYVNGSSTPAVTWTDTGAVIGIGPSTRHAGVVCVGSTSNFGTVSRGYAIDSWTARDL
ncbi:hypothetical protein [Nocardia farcinica]